ncbi:MAG: peptidase S10 [Betaproteobacteria bacterium]|nr:peptidase S10 [Betaproteobacteria bacterium]
MRRTAPPPPPAWRARSAQRAARAATAALWAAALALAGCGGGGGSGAAPAAGGSSFDPVVYSAAANASLPDASESAAVTHHTLSVNAQTLAYTATAGHLSARDPLSGAAEASLFYVAYTLDGAAAGTRPVTFFYNGGPGSASVWLHLGSFGPRRLATGVPSTSGVTPFPLVDNADTLLGVSDLVFVDAVGTGFSEAIAPATNQSYWGVDADAAVFRDFIARYAAVNGRTASPLVVFGESYGTTRSAVLAHLLVTAGMPLKGVVLQSSVLDYNANCGLYTPPAPVSCAGYVPTYGAAGAWYGLDMPKPADLPSYMVQMRNFTQASYAPAVQAYLSAGTPPAASLVTQLAQSTGLAAGYWQQRFNLDPDLYQYSLVSGTLIGRYDARMSAPAGSALASDGDPSSTYITPSFSSAIVSYLANDLHYTTPSSYVMLSGAINTWNFTHDGKALPDTVPDLAAALALAPKLQVLSLNGYHDLATPFHQTELDLQRLGTQPNVQTRLYSGGHMTYLDDTSRGLERADLAAFYAALAP